MFWPSAATAFACAFAFGLTPALQMTSANPGRALASSGNPLQVEFRRGLVIAQVGLSLALLARGGHAAGQQLAVLEAAPGLQPIVY